MNLPLVSLLQENIQKNFKDFYVYNYYQLCLQIIALIVLKYQVRFCEWLKLKCLALLSQ